MFSFVDAGSPREFDKISGVYSSNQIPETFAKVKFFVSDEKVVHLRQSYSVLDILQDLGGFIMILWILGLIIVEPFINHTFQLKTVEQNFFAKYRDKSFSESKDKDYLKRKQEMLKIASESHFESKGFQNTKLIEFSFCQSLILFIRRFPLCCCCGSKKNFVKFFREG